LNPISPSSRSRRRRAALAGFAVLCSLALAPAAAQAQADGSVSAPGIPVISKVQCLEECVSAHTASPGSVVRVRGEFMDYAKQVVFRGSYGPLPTVISGRLPHKADVTVPDGALTSRPYVIDKKGNRSNRAPSKLKIVAAPPAPPTGSSSGVFPVRGPHTYGDGFGAPRSGHTHQGQDILASCGLPIVSAVAGKVTYNAYQSAAGNYVVISATGSNVDRAYMHLVRPGSVKVGQTVSAGQQIGNVGQTGDATGCHLHFEYWIGVWWGGGKPVDPLPYLKQWDKTS
jgi:murein DD-endopeptidase MepM/ murein hydrolase activator NlpD